MLNKLLRFLSALFGLLLIFSSPLIIYALDPEPVIQTVAGTNQGFFGDGGPAAAAQLNNPAGTAVDGEGNIYIADTGNHRIRKVIAATGVITTIAGTDTPGFSGDGGPATAAQLNVPIGVSVDEAGHIYVADYENFRIRKIISPTGVITTVAGTSYGFSGDGGPATEAQLSRPFGVAVDQTGHLYIADGPNSRIRKIISPTGIITTVVGTMPGFAGDDGPATAAQINIPVAVAVDQWGNLYIADNSNQRIRKVIAATGVITTIAGTGQSSFSGDGGPATSAALAYPSSVAVDEAGNLYIADEGNHRVRQVGPSGVITTVAGTGSNGLSGDDGSASAAQLYSPTGLALDILGNLYISDMNNHRIRKVSISGDIGPPQLSMIKTVNLTQNPAWPGDMITYIIVVSNSGSDAVGVRVSDRLPNYVIGVQLSQTVTITAGQAVTFSLAALVANGAPYGITITNTAEYSHSSGSGQASAAFSLVADTTPPVFAPGALISPVDDAALTHRRPVLDWAEAVDPVSGVVSYTLVLTGPEEVGALQASVQVTTTQSVFTPAVDLADGGYRWTVRAHDAAGNAGPFISPAARFVVAVEEEGGIYLPVVLK